jgi:GNAT superfamily N-acetyltransferase
LRYRNDLELAVADPSQCPVGYGLFWFDPVAMVGFVEPILTQRSYQRRGLARHVLISGIDRLARPGATRITISHEHRDPASSWWYPSAGFEFSPDDDVGPSLRCSPGAAVV